MATVPLSLREVRKQQRRVAALLQKEHAIRVPKPARKSILPQHACLCSHLGPDGKNTNPAWFFNREGLLNIQRNRNLRLRVTAGQDYSDPRECYTDRCHSHSHSHLHSLYEDEDGEEDDRLSKRRLKRHGYLSRSFDGVVHRKDIEEFKYSSLRKSDSSLSKLSLPNIHKARSPAGKRKSFLMNVPDNTPIPTGDYTIGRRSGEAIDRSFVLPPIVKENRDDPSIRYQHGVVEANGLMEGESYDDFVSRWDESQTVGTVDASGSRPWETETNGRSVIGGSTHPGGRKNNAVQSHVNGQSRSRRVEKDSDVGGSQGCRCGSPLLHARHTTGPNTSSKEKKLSSQEGGHGAAGHKVPCKECEKTDGTHANWCTSDIYNAAPGPWEGRERTIDSVSTTCGRCGLYVKPRGSMDQDTTLTSQSNRTTRGGVLDSKTSGIYTMSRNNTNNRSTTDSFRTHRERSEAEYSFHYGTEPTQSDIGVRLGKSTTQLSITGDQLLEEGSHFQSRDDLGGPRGVQQKSRATRAKAGSDRKDRSTRRGGRVLVAEDSGYYHGDSNILQVGSLGLEHEEAYADKLKELDQKFQDGDFDYDADVDINDVDTTLRMPSDEEEEEGGEDDDDEEANGIARYGHVMEDPSASKSLTSRSFRTQIFKNGSREAYIKALAARQIQNLPKDAWDFTKRITPAYSFSYFKVNPKCCPDCSMPMVKPIKNPVKKGKRAEMKHIFGNINVDDYYPGGKNNTLESRTHRPR